MDIHKLKLFITLAETLHFHRAAELSHVSPSALSRCIQQIEEELGNRLFERDNRTVSITHQGALFLSFARETLKRWETLQDQMQEDSSKLRGSLSIYCSVTASYSFLYDMLRDFREQQPLIEITLHTGDPSLAIGRILTGHEDIAIAARLDSMPNEVSFKRITRSPLILIQPLSDNWLLETGEEAKLDWTKVPYILSEQGVARARINRWFSDHSITPNIYAQVAGHEAIVSMVSLGLGVGLVPKIVLDNSPLADKVKAAPMQPDLEPYDVGLVVSNKRLKSPIVRSFWQQVQERDGD